MRVEPAIAALLVALASTARAGDVVMSRSKVEAHSQSPWPSQVNKGWQPVFVELRNGGESSRRVDVRVHVNGWNLRSQVTRTLSLAPAESAQVELLAPVLGQAWGFQIEVVVDRSERGYLNESRAANYDARYQSVLALSAATVPAGTTERWTADISTQSIGGRSGSTSVNDDIQFAAMTFERMPASSSAYTSLDLVALDVRGGLPSATQLEPLLAWVRLGGTLALCGPSAREVAQQAPALASWLEPRFALRDEGQATFACALGQLVFVLEDAPFLEGTEQRDRVRELVGAEASTVPDPGGSRVDTDWLAIPGLGRIPHRVFAALLILFAILIGPANFIAVGRRNKPALLLITIPAIALVCSLVLLGYGVFVQGLDVKTAARTLTVLDQRMHRSACVEQRTLFAGASPADGLRPAAGTSVHAILDPSRQASTTRSFYCDESDGRLLSGDYLPTRMAVTQVLLHEQAARGRLTLRRQGEALVAENALAAAIDQLVVRDDRGGWFGTRAVLAPGERVELGALDGQTGADAAQALLGGDLRLLAASANFADGEALPNACYAARLASNPFRDDCGIETNERASEHRLFGVLALDDEAWR